MVNDWFAEWFAEHLLRYNSVHPSWPAIGSEEMMVLIGTWKKSFYPLNITLSEATDASMSLAGNADMRFQNRHMPLILEFIGDARKRTANASGGVPAGGIQEARQRARDCRFCAGEGLLSIDTTPVPEIGMGALNPPVMLTLQSGRQVEARSFSMACECIAGQHLVQTNPDQWGKANLANAPRIKQRLIDIQDGWDRLAAKEAERFATTL